MYRIFCAIGISNAVLDALSVSSYDDTAGSTSLSQILVVPAVLAVAAFITAVVDAFVCE